MVGPRTCPHAEYQASDKQEQANDDEEDGDSSFLANKVDMVDIAWILRFLLLLSCR